MHGSTFYFQLAQKWVWHDIQDSHSAGPFLFTVGRGCLWGFKIEESTVWNHLSCPTWPSRWVLYISMQCLRLKSCHVACDKCAVSGEICSLQHMWFSRSLMWAVTSGGSLKFGVRGMSATNWFSWIISMGVNRIWLYFYIHVAGNAFNN